MGALEYNGEMVGGLGTVLGGDIVGGWGHYSKMGTSEDDEDTAGDGDAAEGGGTAGRFGDTPGRWGMLEDSGNTAGIQGHRRRY